MPYPAHGGGFFCGGRGRGHDFACGWHGRRMAVAEHRPLRSLGQGSAGFCRTLPAQSGNAPLSRLHRQLPLQGSLWGDCHPVKPPLQGEVDAPQAQTEGCGALPRKYLSGSPGGVRPPHVPAKHGSRLCRILQDTPCAKRQCTPQSASPPAPLTGEPLGVRPPPNTAKNAPGRRVPCRGRGCVCFWVRGVFPARSGAY